MKLLRSYLFKPVGKVHYDQILELRICQRDVCPSSHIRTRGDAVCPRPVSQRAVQGCAVHDTVAERAKLCSLHRQTRDCIETHYVRVLKSFHCSYNI